MSDWVLHMLRDRRLLYNFTVLNNDTIFQIFHSLVTMVLWILFFKLGYYKTPQNKISL